MRGLNKYNGHIYVPLQHHVILLLITATMSAVSAIVGADLSWHQPSPPNSNNYYNYWPSDGANEFGDGSAAGAFNPFVSAGRPYGGWVGTPNGDTNSRSPSVFNTYGSNNNFGGTAAGSELEGAMISGADEEAEMTDFTRFPTLIPPEKVRQLVVLTTEPNLAFLANRAGGDGEDEKQIPSAGNSFVGGEGAEVPMGEVRDLSMMRSIPVFGYYGNARRAGGTGMGTAAARGIGIVDNNEQSGNAAGGGWSDGAGDTNGMNCFGGGTAGAAGLCTGQLGPVGSYMGSDGGAYEYPTGEEPEAFGAAGWAGRPQGNTYGGGGGGFMRGNNAEVGEAAPALSSSYQPFYPLGAARVNSIGGFVGNENVLPAASIGGGVGAGMFGPVAGGGNIADGAGGGEMEESTEEWGNDFAGGGGVGTMPLDGAGRAMPMAWMGGDGAMGGGTTDSEERQRYGQYLESIQQRYGVVPSPGNNDARRSLNGEDGTLAALLSSSMVASNGWPSSPTAPSSPFQAAAGGMISAGGNNIFSPKVATAASSSSFGGTFSSSPCHRRQSAAIVSRMPLALIGGGGGATSSAGAGMGCAEFGGQPKGQRSEFANNGVGNNDHDLLRQIVAEGQNVALIGGVMGRRGAAGVGQQQQQQPMVVPQQRQTVPHVVHGSPPPITGNDGSAGVGDQFVSSGGSAAERPPWHLNSVAAAARGGALSWQPQNWLVEEGEDERWAPTPPPARPPMQYATTSTTAGGIARAGNTGGGGAYDGYDHHQQQQQQRQWTVVGSDGVTIQPIAARRNGEIDDALRQQLLEQSLLLALLTTQMPTTGAVAEPMPPSTTMASPAAKVPMPTTTVASTTTALAPDNYGGGEDESASPLPIQKSTTSIQALSQQIRRLPVVLYADSRKADARQLELLLRDNYGLPLVTFYADKIGRRRADAVEANLEKLTAHRGFPYLFICGTFIGSLEHIQNYHQQRQIPRLVEYVCSSGGEAAADKEGTAEDDETAAVDEKATPNKKKSGRRMRRRKSTRRRRKNGERRE